MYKFWITWLVVGMGMIMTRSDVLATIAPTGSVAGNCQECGCACMMVQAGQECVTTSCGLDCQMVDGLCQDVVMDECSQPQGTITELIGWYESYRSNYDSQYDYSCNNLIDINDVIEWYVVYRTDGIATRPTLTGGPLPTSTVAPTGGMVTPTNNPTPTTAGCQECTNLGQNWTCCGGLTCGQEFDDCVGEAIPTVTIVPTVGSCVGGGNPCTTNAECCSNICDFVGSGYECAEEPPPP